MPSSRTFSDRPSRSTTMVSPSTTRSTQASPAAGLPGPAGGGGGGGVPVGGGVDPGLPGGERRAGGGPRGGAAAGGQQPEGDRYQRGEDEADERTRRHVEHLRWAQVGWGGDA